MNEKPLERLNYFNGQRLQAADFKLEQDYHIRVRRWLNRSLYTPGIADGLQVYAIDNAPKVRVMPGLAIDMLGREIILLEEQDVDVVGQHNASGACSGPYLTIRYQEDILQQTTDYCVPCSRSANKPAEQGPARILANPVLELNESLPDVSSGRIALACISLAAGCGSIDFVDPGVRTYIGDVAASKVKQYALEGVRDLDAKNPARIYFHIRGRQPTSVTLYLRSTVFPTLYYTELGWHEHVNALSGNTETGPALAVDNHTHSPAAPTFAHVSDKMDPSGLDAGDWVGGFFTGGLTLLAAVIDKITNSNRYPPKGGLDANHEPAGPAPWYALRVSTLTNEDSVSLNDYVGLNLGKTGNPQDIPAASDLHKHNLNVSFTLDPAGVNKGTDGAYVARGGDGIPAEALTYFRDLQIAIDGHDVTEAARLQVVNNRPQSENWTTLGVGGDHTDPMGVVHVDPMVEYGTGAIRIDYLPGVTLDEDEHYIDLSVAGAGNGGRIHFNLYVE
jgi:hypothetical protein